MAIPPKKQGNRRKATIAPQPNHQRASKIAWGQEPLVSSNVRFLDENDFAKQTVFDNQRCNLFSPEAKVLREELMQTLTRSRSEENLKFLIAIHNLNSQQKISPEKMQKELVKIQIQFINLDAITRINIQDSAFKKIIANRNKNPLDYQDAIKEVFKLIRQNIKKSDLLSKLDGLTYIINSINKLIADLNSFSKLKISGLTFMSNFFPTKTDTKLFVECQKICKAAQDNLRELIKSYKIEDVIKAEDNAETKLSKLNALESVYTTKLTSILSATQKQLIPRFLEIHKLEKARDYFLKSDQVKLAIVAINQTSLDLRLPVEPKLPDIPQKKIKEEFEDDTKPRWTNR